MQKERKRDNFSCVKEAHPHRQLTDESASVAESLPKENPMGRSSLTVRE